MPLFIIINSENWLGISSYDMEKDTIGTFLGYRFDWKMGYFTSGHFWPKFPNLKRMISNSDGQALFTYYAGIKFGPYCDYCLTLLIFSHAFHGHKIFWSDMKDWLFFTDGIRDDEIFESWHAHRIEWRYSCSWEDRHFSAKRLISS